MLFGLDIGLQLQSFAFIVQRQRTWTWTSLLHLAGLHVVMAQPALGVSLSLHQHMICISTVMRQLLHVHRLPAALLADASCSPTLHACYTCKAVMPKQHNSTLSHNVLTHMGHPACQAAAAFEPVASAQILAQCMSKAPIQMPQCQVLQQCCSNADSRVVWYRSTADS